MVGINPNKVLDIVRRDTELIRREAIFLIELDGYGKVKGFFKNPDGRIEVLAVIGQVEDFAISDKPIINQNFGEAVLFELGIKRDKPYHESRNTKRLFGEPYCFCKRRQWFKLSERQFEKVAPIIFDFLQSHTNEEVKKWKCNPLTNPFWLKTTKDWYSRKRGFEFYNKNYALIRGKRFSIALKDRNFVQYVYSAELKYWQEELSGFAKFIDLAISSKRKKKELYKKMSPADFVELTGGSVFSYLKEIVDRKKLPPYLCEELIEKYFPGGKDNILYNEVKHLFSVNGGKSAERVFAESAVVLPDCPILKLKITAGIRPDKDHIVFEVLPTFFDSGNFSEDQKEVEEVCEEVPF
ncbi:hypothetical protein HZC33_01945 [Candidatus Wolfebacteria bacterium]|nr:hypothetical protein [Candidatus Wolfebacteria bacterium]